MFFASDDLLISRLTVVGPLSTANNDWFSSLDSQTTAAAVPQTSGHSKMLVRLLRL